MRPPASLFPRKFFSRKIFFFPKKHTFFSSSLRIDPCSRFASAFHQQRPADSSPSSHRRRHSENLKPTDNILEAPSTEVQEIQMAAFFSAGESKRKIEN
jgi:hypothetical protein